MLGSILARLRRPALAAAIAAAPVAPAHAAPMPVAVVAGPAAGRRKGRNRIVAGGAVVAVAFGAIASHEGYSEKAYIPVKGDVPTICYGETRGIRMGMSRTRAQCDEMFLKGLSDFADGIESCVTRPMGDDLYVAMLSLAYNIGVGSPKHPGFCQSSVVRLYNAGDRRAACNAFLLYDKGGKPRRVLAGLVKRRQAERALCLKGI